MKEITKKDFLSYVGRFTLIHIITYTVITILFSIFQGLLPSSGRVALEFFEPFRPFSFMTVLLQIVRGGILALILYPFYDIIVRGKQGWKVLFGAVWGLALLGSVDPIPGSIEGMIYTETTFVEHVMVLIAGAIQVLLFCWIFLRWEIQSNIKKNSWEPGGVNNG